MADSAVSLVPCTLPPTYIDVHGSVRTVQHARDCSNDQRYDGASQTIDAAKTKGTPEFADTDVIEVNGITTSWDRQRADTAALSAAIHQPVTAIHVATTGSQLGDIALGAIPDKLGVYSTAETRLRSRIESDLASGKDVHIVAHSRGALVTERALEELVHDFRSEGSSDSDVYRKLGHIGVETFGGAGKSFPAGVKNVDYVSEADAVGNTWGKGHPNAYTQNILQRIDGEGDDARLSLSSVLSSLINPMQNDGWFTMRVLGTAVSLEGSASRAMSNGADDTVIRVPSRTPASASPTADQLYSATQNDPLTTLKENHDFNWYLQHRVPYKEALADAPSLGALGDGIDRR